MTGGPCPESEVRDAEERLALRFPLPYFAFLTRLGPGIFYQKHEIFGCRRVMIHDIELLPDLVSMRQRLAGQSATPAHGLFPLHRDRDVLHLIDLDAGPRCGRVLTASNGPEYPDLPAFLEAIVLP